jgi:membrane-associated phospholipid phosphatase
MREKILKLITIKLLLTAALFIASVFIFAFIADEAVLQNEKVFDDAVFDYFSSFSAPGFIDVMKFLTFFGSPGFLVPAYLILIGHFFIERKFRYGLDIAIIGLTSFALMTVLKYIFHRQRPSLPVINGLATYSFPSGHTLSSFIFCSILVFIIAHGKWKQLYKWIVSVLLFLFAIFIGISRIVLRAHYPTDVIASFFLGIVWVITSLWILQKLNRKYIVREDLKPQK